MIMSRNTCSNKRTSVYKPSASALLFIRRHSIKSRKDGQFDCQNGTRQTWLEQIQ